MDKKRAMLQIKNIMDDGADEDHSENSEHEDAAQKDDDRDRRRGGSFVQNDDTMFGDADAGRKRSNSIEGGSRPRARQEHTNVFGSILENIHENINFDDDKHSEEEEEETGESAPSETTANKDGANSAEATGEDYNEHNFVDDLENMEIDDIDEIVSFADNAATRLAAETAQKLKKLMRSAKATQKSEKYIKEQRQKLLGGYNKKKAKLAKYLQSAPFTRTSDKATFVYGVL
jgi:hypothetical protein